MTASETLKLIAKQWCNLSDLMKLAGVGRNNALVIKTGLVDGDITEEAKLRELSTIPSRDGLLTMLAGGLIGTVRNLAICLDLRAQDLEKEEK